jgi:small-conductance mechanosensitive channel
VAVVAPEQRPIRLVVRDDLGRRRLTVFFRLLLAIPHFVWVTLWGLAAFVVAFILWLAVLIEGKAPTVLHDFVAGYLRYATQLGGYLLLAASPYPGFRGRPGYPIDLEIDAPERQSRWTGFFRLLLAIPALLLAATLGGGLSIGSPGGSWGAAGGREESATWSAITLTGAAAAAAFLAWFAILARGHAPRGLRDLVAYALGYSAQAAGYLFLLTGRYPTSDPALAEAYAELPAHPVQIVVADDLERPRLTVLFRLLLAIPHLVWLLLWLVAALFAAVAAWFAALFTGRVPASLHRFLAAYLRYTTHVIAYVYVIGRKFPGFTGRAGSYGIDIEIAPPESQSRWKTLFRLFLAIPALILNSALGGVALVVAFLGWWYALVTGRMPEGLRNLGVACLRYSAQTYAYLFLLTARYPYAAPVLEGKRHGEAEEPTPTSPLPVSGDAF